jgi:hypothetical protein
MVRVRAAVMSSPQSSLDCVSSVSRLDQLPLTCLWRRFSVISGRVQICPRLWHRTARYALTLNGRSPLTSGAKRAEVPHWQLLAEAHSSDTPAPAARYTRRHGHRDRKSVGMPSNTQGRKPAECNRDIRHSLVDVRRLLRRQLRRRRSRPQALAPTPSLASMRTHLLLSPRLSVRLSHP